ncbi:DUF4129 domain-containing protein [Nocardiopsis exhalans]|uniref:DUF4129 domain-containing protein n=1 Tax=Nocardiopsis exhalans TaxID=163604 RepID=A0ABY5D410_9ACTN|nr:DUF4129 domain-containing protein [Nocardiopsis exhalans]USY19099.1 DUF4129 domain-containing protein [Nocardiopsis exhalans]
MRPLHAAPLEVTREEGRRRAIEELSDPVYGQNEPSLLDRLLMWLGEFLDWLGRAGEGVVPGGWLLAGVLLVVLVLVVAMIFYLRPSRNRRVEAPLHEGEVRTAADHRALSERAEAVGDFAAAVTERLRAISVDLEDRVIISPKAGRTATELAAEAARTLPVEAGGLHEGARIFNDVAYGDRAATADTARFMRELDGRLSAARPVLSEPVPAGGAPTGSAEPPSHHGGPAPTNNQPYDEGRR